MGYAVQEPVALPANMMPILCSRVAQHILFSH